MNWTDSYVGIRFKDLGRDRDGCDCWGLVRLVYSDRLAIQLPSFAGAYASTEDRAQTEALFENGRSEWIEVDGQIRPYDVLMFRVMGYRSHVGVAVDRRMMLHVSDREQAKIEHLRALRWSNRFVRAYRHSQLAEAVA